MSKILIVEDEIIIAFHLETLMKRSGHQVCEKINNAGEAIKAVKNSTPDLVLLDIMLADKSNGLEAATAIRKFSDIPIIFMSALSDGKTLEKIDTIKNSRLVNKPFDQNILLKFLEELLP